MDEWVDNFLLGMVDLVGSILWNFLGSNFKGSDSGILHTWISHRPKYLVFHVYGHFRCSTNPNNQ